MHRRGASFYKKEDGLPDNFLRAIITKEECKKRKQIHKLSHLACIDIILYSIWMYIFSITAESNYSNIHSIQKGVLKF
jgi:hypothetical protein